MPEPPKHIIKELKNIDSGLDVKWDNRIRRFMVNHRDKRGKVYPVLKVQYQDGTFKPLDRRTVDSIRYSNCLRYKKPQDILYEIDKQNEQNEIEKQKKLRDDGYAIAKDMPRGFLNLGGI